MKIVKKLFAATVAFAAIGTAAFADKQKVEAYAHPTLFGTQSQTLVDGEDTYQIGGQILKSKNRLGVKNKDNVYISSWSKDLLKLIKETQEKAGYSKDLFNPKMPILRSELAFAMAEGLNTKAASTTKGYTDIADNYWAKDWIYSATNADVMIGYPSGAFKPDQPITKAEVFATIAKQINVKYENGVPTYKGKTIKYIPEWAYNATNEVVASGLLNHVPDTNKIINSEYLSKEQVAYIVGALRKNSLYAQNVAASQSASKACAKQGLTTLRIKLLDRLSAKTANVGDAFTAKTCQDVVVAGQSFPAGSIVRGEVIEVERPGSKNCKNGYIKVKFVKIKDLETNCEAALPSSIASANADAVKNPNFVARLLGFPFSGAGRIVGVAGRTAGGVVNVAANGLEEIGDNLSNTFVETLTAHPGRGMASAGNVLSTTGKGIFDFAKLIVSGTFGVVYELADEIVYVFVPSLSNSSSLNPNEELTIVF